jgi:glucokinase
MIYTKAETFRDHAISHFSGTLPAFVQSDFWQIGKRGETRGGSAASCHKPRCESSRTGGARNHRRKETGAQIYVNFPYPVLVCDIGGTNVRFSIASRPGAALGPVFFSKTADHDTFEAAIAAGLPHFSPMPRSLIVCAAGPVEGRKLKLTNAAWLIDGEALADRFGFAQGLLLNDFEAQALSLPVLPSDGWSPIGPDFPSRRGAQVILGCGTGLGVAALVECDGRFLALPSEAGHMTLSPSTAEEEAFWPQIETGSVGRVSGEMLLSGPGLVRLHQARLRASGHKTDGLSEASEIGTQAVADRNSEAAQSVRLMFNLLARFAGDLALAYMARGGVTFSGGILPKLIDRLDAESFRRLFEAKAPHQALMREIGTRLIAAESEVLLGMAEIAHRPGLYAIDYGQRAWR